MKKNDWYENRILWRAGKLGMKSRLWSDFIFANEKAAKEIVNKIDGYGSPLLVFFLNLDNWTVITNQFLVGKLNGIFSAIFLDEMGDVITDNEMNLPPDEIKRKAQVIRVGSDKLLFWTPMGNDHFSIRNILKMFPIGVP